MSKLIDMTNQTFGYWKVLERGPNNARGKAQWKCLCTLCNSTIKLVDGAHLRGGRSTSCGCTKMEKMRRSQIKDETGKTYGYLYVNYEVPRNEEPRQDDQGVYWNCTCLKCGRANVVVKGDYLRNGDTTSCGCITSKNEVKIASLLDATRCNYKRQYWFDDLKTSDTNYTLYFDFGVLNSEGKLQYCIEFDGIQHFYEGKHWGNENALSKTRQHDLIKNKYCFKNNIPLIRIPYNAEYTLDDLKLETTRFLLTEENEQQYYRNLTK